MSKRDVIGCSFGTLFLIGSILVLAFGTSPFFQNLLGISRDACALVLLTGCIFWVMGLIGYTFSDPLMNPGSL